MRRLGLTILSILVTAVTLVAALPLGERAWLAWGMLIPVLFAVRQTRFVIGFLVGILTIFFAAWLSTQGWLYPAYESEKNDAWIYTGFGIFGFSFSIGLGIYAETAHRLKPYAIAAVAILLEAVLLVELPAHLALTQYRNAVMVQLASVTGIWGVSFLIWWVNVAFVDRWLTRPRERRWQLGAFIGLVGLIALLSNAWLPGAPNTRTVAALQVGEPTQGSLLAGQKEAEAAQSWLTVWPEFAGITLVTGGDTQKLRSLSAGPFVTSFQDGLRPLPHNVASLFRNGNESVRYEKRKLFGGESKMHVAGAKATAIGEIGLNICFDSCFPNVIRETAALDPTLLALPTIDPPSTHHFIAAMHAAYTPFRAAENGIAVVRADGYFASMIVDPRGKIVEETKAGDQLLLGQVPETRRLTINRYFGDGMLWLAPILIVWSWRRGASQSGRETPDPKSETGT